MKGNTSQRGHIFPFSFCHRNKAALEGHINTPHCNLDCATEPQAIDTRMERLKKRRGKQNKNSDCETSWCLYILHVSLNLEQKSSHLTVSSSDTDSCIITSMESNRMENTLSNIFASMSIYAFVSSTKCCHLCFSLRNLIVTTPSATWTLYIAAINLPVYLPQPESYSVVNTVYSSPSCQSAGCYPGLSLVFHYIRVFSPHT